MISYEELADPTEVLTRDLDDDTVHGAVSPPIFQTSIFAHATVAEMRRHMDDEEAGLSYSRGNNPTVRMVERKLAALEHGEDARLFSSGVAAIAAAVLSVVRAGDHAIVCAGVYGWTRYLFEHYLSRFGFKRTYLRREK